MFSAGSYLRIPVLTVRSKLTISNLRNSLKVDIFEAIECLKSWTKGGLILLLKKEIEDMNQTMDLSGAEDGSI